MGESGNNIAGIVRELSNSNLNPDTQEMLINDYLNNGNPDGDVSIMDKIFGNKNPQMYVTLIMSVMLIFVAIYLTINFKTDMEFIRFVWEIVMPAVTLLWGYSFGKSQSK